MIVKSWQSVNRRRLNPAAFRSRVRLGRLMTTDCHLMPSAVIRFSTAPVVGPIRRAISVAVANRLSLAGVGASVSESRTSAIACRTA
jgi:hypothetical protein